jgi:hypothetical protein
MMIPAGREMKQRPVFVPPRIPDPRRYGICSRDGLACDLDKRAKGCRHIPKGKWAGKCFFRMVQR